MTQQIDKDYFETNKFELIFTGKSKGSNSKDFNSKKQSQMQDLKEDVN